MAKDPTTNRSAAIGTAALLSLALGAPLQAQDDEAPAAVRTCLNQPTIKRTKVLNDRNIVFVTRDEEIYNNQLPKQCPSLKRGDLVNYSVDNSRLCAGSVFQVLEVLWQLGERTFIPTFICELGPFVPITADELEDLMTMTAAGKDRRDRGRSKREAVTAEPVELPPAESAAESATAPASE